MATIRRKIKKHAKKKTVELQLIDELDRLHRTIENVNKFHKRFALGIVSGLGSALGATVIFALLVFLFFQFFKGTSVERFIEETGIEAPFIERR